MSQKRVLVVSYNSFSRESANGRTLEFLVGAYDTDHISQVYFSGETPDFSVCHQYYRVSENQLLKSVLKRKKAGGRVSDTVDHTLISNPDEEKITGGMARYAKKNKRSVWVKFFRNMLWKIGRKKWQTQEFDEWIQDVSPDVILAISGKNSCFHDITVDLSRKYHLPLVVYHCEDYCMKNTQGRSFLYKRYINGLKKSIKRMMEYASLAIYNSNRIKQIYEEIFQTPSLVAYMSTDMIPREEKKTTSNFHPMIFSYIGNLGLNRYCSLYEISQALKKVAPGAVLNIYAPSVPYDFVPLLESTDNMNYKGFVSYYECRKIMVESDVLVHAESFDEKTKSDLHVAFSTKIADSLASGVPFFVYAPIGIASTDYLLETHSACIATNSDELYSKLIEFVNSETVRQEYVTAAKRVAKENHSFVVTTEMIANSIRRVVETQKENHGKL